MRREDDSFARAFLSSGEGPRAHWGCVPKEGRPLGLEGQLDTPLHISPPDFSECSGTPPSGPRAGRAAANSPTTETIRDTAAWSNRDHQEPAASLRRSGMAPTATPIRVGARHRAPEPYG
jgi:hypothetical protein